MRFSSSALLGWCSVALTVAVLGTGCANTAPSSTLPEPETSRATRSLLVPEELPTPPVREAGVAAIFGPGTNIPKAAAEVIGLIQKAGSKAA